MEADLVLVDTNIIIEVLRNNKEIISAIKSFGIEKLAVSCITVMELYYGALNNADLRKIKKYIEAFEIIQINQEISYTLNLKDFKYIEWLKLWTFPR